MRTTTYSRLAAALAPATILLAMGTANAATCEEAFVKKGNPITALRFTAAVTGRFSQVVVSAEAAVWKGRRFGNLVVLASDHPLPVERLGRTAASAAFPYRLLAGRDLTRWLGGAQPFTDEDAVASPAPASGRSWFS